jgi:hypothetical protein
MEATPASAVPNHIREEFAPYLEDTNRYLPACLRARYAQLRDTAVAVDRIRVRLEAVRVGVAAAREIMAAEAAARPADKNTTGSS